MTTDATFRRLGRALRSVDLGRPQVVVNVAALERNVDRITRKLGGRSLRLVVKSLPCAELLELVMRRAATARLMAFDVPTLLQCLHRWPEADLMLGKPLPAASVDRVLEHRQWRGSPSPALRVHWLVDTPHRMEQYAGIARKHSTRLGVCLELDVGLHRGGAGNFSELDALIAALDAAGPALELRGFMGYDAHAAKAPWPRNPQRAAARACARYEELVTYARRKSTTLTAAATIVDGGGSPTYALYPDSGPPHEVALGSALVKPSDFDLPALEDVEPAAWIATPVLKDLPGIRLPFLEWAAALTGRGRRSLFVHGGRWMAKPAWPPGLEESALFGLSSNQQFMSVPADAPVGVDDYVFFRPTQSEVVLAQFGFLTAVFENGAPAHWPAFSPVETPLDD